MERQIATLVLEDAWCLAGTPVTIERTLARMPGVIRAFVSPVVETVYVEYDGDRCTAADLLLTIESLGMRATLPPPDRRPPRRPS